MERQHVSLVDSPDAQESTPREEESVRRSSLQTLLGEGVASSVTHSGMKSPVHSQVQDTSSTVCASSRGVSGVSRDLPAVGPSQAFGSVDTVGSQPDSLQYRSRRSVRHKSSIHAASRTAAPKHNLYVVQLEGDSGGIEMQAASQHLLRAIRMRTKYKSVDKGQREGAERLTPPVVFTFETGVIQFSGQRTAIVSWEQFYDDIMELYATMQHPDCRRACSQRLQVLEEKYNLYKLCNSKVENSDHRRDVGVFANCTKVDNGVHLSYIMNAQWLHDHIHEKIEHDGEALVWIPPDKGEPQTLHATLEQLGFADAGQPTIDSLGLMPPSEKRRYHYDALDPELNRAGRNCTELLRLFLTPDTVNNGKYLAEVAHAIISQNDERTHSIQATECVIDLYGTSTDNWEKLASWMQEHDLLNWRCNRWLIALPRRHMRQDSMSDIFETHQQHLENIFLPLFMATLAPEDPKNASVAALLQCIGGFVIVSDEEERDYGFERKLRRPLEVPWSENVCDLYFAYHIWANLCSLNSFRRRKGLNTLQLRAFAGGRDRQIDVLVYSYLLCDSLVNGVVLEHHPVLQYLYGSQRIGLIMLPLCNNGMGLPYMQNPFPTFFCRGLNVTLTTNRPLLFHHSNEPLIEEYGTASKLFQLSGTDICEIAMNSVMVSSFPHETKALWLGESFQDGARGNMAELSKVPTARLELRYDVWHAELNIIMEAAKQNANIEVGDGLTPVHSVAGYSSVSRSLSNNLGLGDPNSVNLHQTATLMQSGQVVPPLTRDPHTDFPRVVFVGPLERNASDTSAMPLLHRALHLRSQYVRKHHFCDVDVWAMRSDEIEHAFRRDDTFDEDEWMFKTVGGVVVPHEVHQIPRLPKDMFHYEDFRAHVQELRGIIENAHVRNFAARRLNILERKFMLHLAVNRSLEAGTTASKASKNHDFYQATKVDNNVRMESGMTARQLLNFIVSKANNNGDDIVAHQEGREPQTLRQLLQELQISPSTLTVDDLNVQVDATLGVASAQYTPGGRDVLCTLLLNTDNQMKGRYFAELTKLTFENFEHDRFTFTENRLPIYGASSKEWELLSDWFDTHGMASVHNRWMVQIPRIYSYLRERGKVQSFAEYIENIFKPLWTVSLHPSKDPRLFHFINHISGFDCVEDERRHDAPLNTATRPPHEWTTEEEPPYNYYMYHVWANIYSLNEFRRRRKFSTFSFRPSCGETGPVEHLIGGFLLANAINYGVTLADDAPLQYLFYLARIGVTVSPLSNNTKVLGYLDNPFPTFFRRGLNVSLGTDSPLMFHHTQEPLLEEYSIASKVWKLSPNDMCEIARNSVLLSGFDANFKRERLGDLFFLSSSRSNDASHTHLSDIRVAYRFETYHSEISLLEMISSLVFPKALLTLSEESALEAQFRAACEKEPQLGCIIEVKADDVDMNKLQQNRDLLQRQLDEVGATVDELRRQNKQLTEKLAEERARDQQAQALRRRGVRRYEGFLPPEEGRPGTGAGARFSLSIRRGVAPGDELVEESGQEENSTNHMNQQQQETGLVASPRAQPANPAVALARASCQSPANSCPGVLSRSTGSKSAVVALVGMSENMWSHSETRSEGRPAASGEDNTLPPINDDITPANDIIVMTQRRKCSQPTPPPPKRGLSRPPLMLPEALDEVEAEDDAEDNSTVMD